MENFINLQKDTNRGELVYVTSSMLLKIRFLLRAEYSCLLVILKILCYKIIEIWFPYKKKGIYFVFVHKNKMHLNYTLLFKKLVILVAFAR